MVSKTIQGYFNLVVKEKSGSYQIRAQRTVQSDFRSGDKSGSYETSGQRTSQGRVRSVVRGQVRVISDIKVG